MAGTQTRAGAAMPCALIPVDSAGDARAVCSVCGKTLLLRDFYRPGAHSAACRSRAEAEWRRARNLRALTAAALALLARARDPADHAAHAARDALMSEAAKFARRDRRARVADDFALDSADEAGQT